jgi:hypothetical protein
VGMEGIPGGGRLVLACDRDSITVDCYLAKIALNVFLAFNILHLRAILV